MDDVPRRKLYPTRDPEPDNYFIKDQIPAKGSFAPYYKKYLQHEKTLL